MHVAQAKQILLGFIPKYKHFFLSEKEFCSPLSREENNLENEVNIGT